MVQDVKLHKKKITEVAINFMAKILKPLKAIEGQGLSELVQMLFMLVLNIAMCVQKIFCLFAYISLFLLHTNLLMQNFNVFSSLHTILLFLSLISFSILGIGIKKQT